MHTRADGMIVDPMLPIAPCPWPTPRYPNFWDHDKEDRVEAPPPDADAGWPDLCDLRLSCSYFLPSFFPSFLPALAFPFHSLPVRSSQRKTFMFDCNCKALIVEKLMGPQSPASRLFLSAAPASLPSLLCARVSKDV